MQKHATKDKTKAISQWTIKKQLRLEANWAGSAESMYNLTLNCSWVISTILKLHQGNCAWKVLSHCICFKAWLSYVRASPHYRLGRLPAANNEHSRRLEPDLSLITHTEIRKQLSHSSFVDGFFSQGNRILHLVVWTIPAIGEKRETPRANSWSDYQVMCPRHHD